jgi:hypothetical protein
MPGLGYSSYSSFLMPLKIMVASGERESCMTDTFFDPSVRMRIQGWKPLNSRGLNQLEMSCY